MLYIKYFEKNPIYFNAVIQADSLKKKNHANILKINDFLRSRPKIYFLKNFKVVYRTITILQLSSFGRKLTIYHVKISNV